jgi:hypothetical protein
MSQLYAGSEKEARYEKYREVQLTIRYLEK